jgi:hypothetical protein
MSSVAVLKAAKGDGRDDMLLRPAAGLEAEFTLIVDDKPAKPEEVFGDPRGFLRVPLMHRTGRSFHLPTGAAVYFDTGVIELATPVMELERGCFTRLARSLDASLMLVREQLDQWERRSGHRVRLQGFSAHYNVSPRQVGSASGRAHRFDRAAWLLAHILPAPVMLLATNRESTGVGVRPRPPRVEVTADYSPDWSRIAATGAVVGAVVADVSRWSDLSLDALRRARIPVIERFVPCRHTSRRGWLARYDCYPTNPFVCDPDEAIWSTSLGRVSLREIGTAVWRRFERSIARIADAASFTLARRILTGRSESWLDHRERPRAYDDVGRLPRATSRGLPRAESRGPRREPDEPNRVGSSRYERVVLNTIARRPLRLEGSTWIPEAVRGWSRIVLRRDDGVTRVLPLDALVPYLADWER